MLKLLFFHTFPSTALSGLFLPHAHTHILVHSQTALSLLLTAEDVNTGLFDESVRKQPCDLSWRVPTHSYAQMLSKRHVV